MGRLGLEALPVRIKNISTKKRIWLHALSVGETASALPLARFFRDNGYDAVFSVSTMTGRIYAEKNLPEVPLFYFPYDILFSVRRVMDKIRPDIIILTESDLWPCFIWEAKKRNIPLIWANARMSDRSYKRYQHVKTPASFIFSAFSAIAAQSGEDRDRLISLGANADDIIVTGNLKYDITLNADAISKHNLKASQFNPPPKKPVFIAGSTHAGEEEIIATAVAGIKKIHPSLFVIIAPRDPVRWEKVKTIFESKGFYVESLTRFEALEGKPEKIDLVVVDMIGRLKYLYSDCDIAFVGGSLIPVGGHNPLEPAIMAKPVLFGSYMNDFREIAEDILQSGGAEKVMDAAELEKKILDLLSNPNKRIEMGNKALSVIDRNKGATKKTIEIILKTLCRSSLS